MVAKPTIISLWTGLKQSTNGLFCYLLDTAGSDCGDKKCRYLFDFAIPDKKVAFEIEGGVWSKGRHLNPIGFMKDCKKYNLATYQGWKVYRIPSPWLEKELIPPKTKAYLFGTFQVEKFVKEVLDAVI